MARIQWVSAWVLVLACAGMVGQRAQASDYQELVTLSDAFQYWKADDNSIGRVTEDAAGQPIEPVPDYSPQAIDMRLEMLASLQSELASMDYSRWSRSQQVDWLALRSRLDQHEYRLRVSRYWARDPGFYVDRMLWLTFTELPVKGAKREQLLAELRGIPVLVSAAQTNLTDVAADFASLAIHNLSNSDGVGHGHPYRETPPEGVIGWYNDLAERARATQPELLPDIEAAREAVVALNDWLLENRDGWTASAGSGKAAFDWYLKHVKLMPWTSDDLVIIGERELDRLWSLYALEQHRNREEPLLSPATTGEDYRARIAATDEKIRRFLVEQDIITIPDYVGELDTNVPWQVRPAGLNFWEAVQFRDPAPDHLHAVIPGHRFDILLADNLAHPIRKHIRSGARIEGWATYLEEAMLQAGMFADTPRVRELIHVFGIFRAARVPADVWLQTDQMTAPEVVSYWREQVPFLDEDVARVDAEIYLRRPPGYGVGYSIGKVQMDKLLADRKRQLGDEFNLKDFHDAIMDAGPLPLSLVRWEMTGLDDEVKQLWSRDPIPLD